MQRLNVMEVPDILAWVKPHELLLTTGYPLRNTPQSLDRLVADLDERGLAALAIKLGRYLDELPDVMVEQADRLGFPLIQLPDDVGFDDILNQVLTDILNRQAGVLARVEEAHRALVAVVLAGGGLREVAAEVAGLLGVAVAVLDGAGQTLAAAGPAEYLAALRGAPNPAAPPSPSSRAGTTTAGSSPTAPPARSTTTTSASWNVPPRSRPSWSPGRRRSTRSRASTGPTSCAMCSPAGRAAPNGSSPGPGPSAGIWSAPSPSWWPSSTRTATSGPPRTGWSPAGPRRCAGTTRAARWRASPTRSSPSWTPPPTPPAWPGTPPRPSPSACPRPSPPARAVPPPGRRSWPRRTARR
nr:hypothetical protein GCM10020093_040040 [Planobispora longispora]